MQSPADQPPEPDQKPPHLTSAESHLAAMRAMRPLPRPVRALLVVLAVLCLAAGIAGIFIPGLPTTVFILAAAWAAGRSSPRLYAWLVMHRIFGPMIINWHNGGTVSRKAKWSASAAMVFCALVMSCFVRPWWFATFGIACMAVVCAWLWFRPEPRTE